MLRVVYADGWFALYGEKDNILYQGDILDPDEMLRVLGIEHTIEWAQDQLDELGDFPEAYTDVVPDE